MWSEVHIKYEECKIVKYPFLLIPQIMRQFSEEIQQNKTAINVLQRAYYTPFKTTLRSLWNVSVNFPVEKPLRSCIRTCLDVLFFHPFFKCNYFIVCGLNELSRMLFCRSAFSSQSECSDQKKPHPYINPPKFGIVQGIFHLFLGFFATALQMRVVANLLCAYKRVCNSWYILNA